VELVAAWWTDPIGRKHWFTEANEWHESEYPLSRRPPFEAPVCWISPPGTSGLRVSGEKREVIVICRCGVVGTTGSVAWMGDRCGPCSDREEEGLPPAGPPVVRPLQQPLGGEPLLSLLDGGRFLTRDPNGGGTSVLRLWDGLDDTSPVCEAPAFGGVFTENGRLLAAVSPDGEVTIHDIRTGAACGRFEARVSGGGTRQAAWARLGERWRLVLCCSEDNPELIGLDISPTGAILGEAWRTRARGRFGPILIGGRGGEYFLAKWWDRIERRAASSGAVAEILAPGAGLQVDDVWVIDGRITARVEKDWKTQSFAEWDSKTPQDRVGFWGWLAGPPRREPDRIVPTDSSAHKLTAAPDGEVATLEGHRGLEARCARTFRLRATFHPAEYWLSGPMSFTPDGRLLIDRKDGLVVYPWRELMGSP
jgi:hypothetical protein